MSKKDERRIVEVVARKNSSGKYDVVTAFLGNTVGSILGPSVNLSQQEATLLAQAWMDRQRYCDKQDADSKTVKVSKNLKPWD